jgi:hypothetical protein
MRVLALLIFFSAACFACALSSPPPPADGHSGDACRPDDTCDPGLFCDVTDCGLNPPFIACDPTNLCRPCNAEVCPGEGEGEGDGEGE